MNVDFKYLPEFEKRAKALAKKYKSFVKDYDDFLLRKIRIKVYLLEWEFTRPAWR